MAPKHRVNPLGKLGDVTGDKMRDEGSRFDIP